MEKKTSKVKHFLKKNVYYIIMAVCLLAIAAMIVVTVLIGNGVISGENVNEDVTPAIKEEPVQEPDNTQEPAKEEPKDDPKPIEKEPETPTPTAIVFTNPVQNINVLQSYSMDALVWNSTLKHYAVHNGIDFGGNDGDSVLAVYDGTVTSVSYDVLNGHTVTIKHNDELSTVYSSMNEPLVKQGQTVRKGEKIGTMGTTATAEYSMGAHLHFTVLENGKPVSPDSFLTFSEAK